MYADEYGIHSVNVPVCCNVPAAQNISGYAIH